MAAPRKYSEELKDRATRMACEARRDPDSSRGAIKRIADQLGVHPEALRNWVRQAEIEDMEEKWSQRNKEIIAKYPTGSEPEGGAPENILPSGEGMEPLAPERGERNGSNVSAEAPVNKVDRPASPRAEAGQSSEEPGLPFDETNKDS